ncbi:MAG: hypothetical protein AMXMBFR66_37330 [Pseudomonadota bacterium]|nr:cyclic nucleotide-binding domain-containing protein [Rubrivivax sp.]
MALEGFVAARIVELQAMLADPVQWVALAAALVAGALVIVSAVVKTIVPLRWLAVGGNLGFVVYGFAHPAPMVLLLHLALLPINLWRVLEMQRLTRRVQRAEAGAGAPQVWLQRYMKRRRLRVGAVVFRQGDPADRLYVLAEGRLEVEGTGRFVVPGEMFGEIAFFAPDRRRTHTLRCVQEATLLSIDEATFRQLFFQNPAFGFAIVRLVVARLSADARHAQPIVPPAANAPPEPHRP